MNFFSFRFNGLPNIPMKETSTDVLMSRIPNISLKPDKTYVDIDDLRAKKPPITEDLSSGLNECLLYQREFRMLDYLTKSNCSSTPRYIASFQRNEVNPWIRDGFLCFVVMEKVPGRRVSDIWKYDPTENQCQE